MKVWHNGDNIWFELSHEEDYFQAFQRIFDRRLVVSVTSIRTAMQLVLNLVDCINSWWGEDDDKRSEGDDPPEVRFCQN